MTSFEVEFLLVEVNTGRPVGVRVLAAGGHCGLMRCMTCVWCLPLQSASTSPMFLHSEFPIENRTNYGEPQSAGSCSAPRPCACEPPTPPAHRPPLGRAAVATCAELFRKFLLKNRSEPYHKRLSDFHALVYLGELFDMEVRAFVAEDRGIRAAYSPLMPPRRRL